MNKSTLCNDMITLIIQMDNKVTVDAIQYLFIHFYTCLTLFPEVIWCILGRSPFTPRPKLELPIVIM